MSNILLIDDSTEVHYIMKEVFANEHIVHSAYNLDQALQGVQKHNPELILLDINLPDGSGLDFFAKLKSQAQTRNIPVIFLTGKNDISSKSIGFSLGADDYIVKPFDPAEVKIRVESKLRKKLESHKREAQFQVGDLRFAFSSNTVHLMRENGEVSLEITPICFKLLLFLSQNTDQAFTRDQLISSVWGTGVFIHDRTVDAHIKTLRKLLSHSNISIQTVHGHGYKLKVAA